MNVREQSPILSQILNILGALAICFGILIGVLEFFQEGGFLNGVFIIAGAIFTGLIYFGISQVIQDINRTANNTERLEIAITRLANNLQTATKPAPPWKAPTSEARGDAYFYFDGTSQIGPFNFDDLRDFYSSGVIDENTQVSGGELPSWIPLNQSGELFRKIAF